MPTSIEICRVLQTSGWKCLCGCLGAEGRKKCLRVLLGIFVTPPVFFYKIDQNLDFFPKQCGHTEGVLTVRVKAGCSFEVVLMSPVVAYGIFPVNFRAKWLLQNINVHFDWAGSHKTVSAEVSPAIFADTKSLLWNVHVHFHCAGSHKTRHLIQKSCQEGACQELLPGDLLETSCPEALPRDLLKRSAQRELL